MDIFWYYTLFMIIAKDKQKTTNLYGWTHGEMHMLRTLSSVWVLCRAKYLSVNFSNNDLTVGLISAD